MSVKKRRSEKETCALIDNIVLAQQNQNTFQFKSSCGGYGLMLRDKSKLALIKRIRVKEERGWECAAPISYKDEHYFVKMIFNRKPLREQV